MSLEEANYFVRFHIDYVGDQWRWAIDTMQPYGTIIGYNYYDTPNEALEELKDFMRYFTKNVLKNGDTIRAYVNKHNPNKKEE
jgi:hypothetical protein